MKDYATGIDEYRAALERELAGLKEAQEKAPASHRREGPGEAGSREGG